MMPEVNAAGHLTGIHSIFMPASKSDYVIQIHFMWRWAGKIRVFKLRQMLLTCEWVLWEMCMCSKQVCQHAAAWPSTCLLKDSYLTFSSTLWSLYKCTNVELYQNCCQKQYKNTICTLQSQLWVWGWRLACSNSSVNVLGLHDQSHPQPYVSEPVLLVINSLSEGVGAKATSTRLGKIFCFCRRRTWIS